MSQTNYLNNHFSSDQQTVTPAQTIQQPIVTLQYLLNQNKMKEIALTKATHLIELYKIQLQVKEQDYIKQIEQISERQKQNYHQIINQLENKILHLQKQLKSYELKIKELEKRPHDHFKSLPEPYQNNQNKLNQSATRIPKITRNNSGKDLSNNRKTRYSHGKNVSGQPNSMKRSISNFISQQAIREIDSYRVQKTFLIQYILKSQEKDQKLINLLENQFNSENQIFTELKAALKFNQRTLDQFLKQLKEPSVEIQNRLKEYREVIKIQELIIEELNGQLTEYQNLFNVMNSSLQEIYSKDTEPSTFDDMRFSIITSSNSLSRNQPSFEEFRETIDMAHQNTLGKLKQHKSFIKQKIANMQAENKELKRILDDMIKLIKNNKKMQMGTFGSIKSTKNTEDPDPMKQKSKSHMLYRK